MAQQDHATAAVTHSHYSDDFIRDALSAVKTIAIVGASENWNRPSYFVMKYMQQKGYRVIPVNPRSAGNEILGERVVGDLSEIDVAVDMVDIFRASNAAGAFADQATEIGAKVVWMQLGVRDDAAAARAEAAGLTVIMDRCPKIEFSRLFGELGWHGFNSRVISSKRRLPGVATSASRASADAVEAGRFQGFETAAIHAGAAPDPVTGARATPIYQTTAYVFEDADHAASLFNLQTFGNIYGRLSNPTVAVLEERIAALEDGRGTTCTASGHSAQMIALFPLMGPGDHFIAANRLYGGSITQFGRTFQKFDWQCSFVDTDDVTAVKAAITDRTKALFAESLVNPGGAISDIRALADIAEEAGIPLIIDNTMATPFLCQPIKHGANIVVHSTTKFLSGHGNAMGGAVVDAGNFDWGASDRFPSLAAPEPAYHGLNFWETFGDLAYTTYGHAVGLRDLGPTMAPMNAFLTITGIETLALRMQRHVENAQTVAAYLADHPKVAWVSHASQPDSPYHQRAKTYLPKGAGSVFTFGINGGYSDGVRFVERCELLSHLANIGDTRSLVLHPASTTHRQLTEAQRLAAGAGDEVIRLSIGLESIDDIIADISYALN